LERKRHLGNDVVLVVFWEGDGEFDPNLVKSQFNHVFFVISVDSSSIPELGKIRYRLSIVCKSGVPRWEPFMPYPSVFDRVTNKSIVFLFLNKSGRMILLKRGCFTKL
jgi:RAP1 GTPase activating protein 1